MGRRLFLILTFLAALLYSCDSAPRIEPLSQDAIILAFGDSLTYGTGAPAGKSYPDILSRLLNRTVVNSGIPGEVSAKGRQRLQRELEKHNPDLVILCHGGNDFLRRYDQDTTVQNLKSMVTLIKEQGIDVILIGVPKFGFGLYVPDFYSTIAEEFDIPYEQEILVDLLSENNLKSDAIHPNAAGYQLMADAIYKTIQKSQ